MMAPGTKPQQQRDISLTGRIENDEFNDIMNNVEVPDADPWQVPDQEIIAVGDAQNQSFEDSFVSSPSDNDTGCRANYEHNSEYLAYLEAKLRKMESRRKINSKVTARDVLNSLKEAKETQLNWNMQQGESSMEDDAMYSDSSGSSGYSLPKELKRKMFPEQQALNESEILHLLEHDVIEKVIGQFHKSADK